MSTRTKNIAPVKPIREITDGGRDLRVYLDEIEQSVPDFCEMHELDRITVQRVMNGERHRISVDFAHDIEKATKGRIAWSSFRSATAREAGAPRRRKAS